MEINSNLKKIRLSWMSKVLKRGKWIVTMNEKPLGKLKTFPVREGVVKHNSMLMYIYASILMFLTYTTTIITINKTNKKLSGEYIQLRKFQDKVPSLQVKFNKDEEKKLKRSGRLIVKWKIGWVYAPDQLEKWLEGMEEQGHNLYRVSDSGAVFYFMKGESRRVSYCADFKHRADRSYFNIHREAGWEIVFISSSLFQKWVVWSLDYLEGEERPQLYSDRFNQLKLARRIAIMYSSMFIPIILINILNTKASLDLKLYQMLDQKQIISMLIWWSTLVFLGFFTCRTWLYYRRLSKFYK